MKKLAAVSMTLALALALVGCGAQPSVVGGAAETESSRSNAHPVPDGYQLAQVGSVATFLPEEWTIMSEEHDAEAQNDLIFYTLPGVDQEEASVAVMRIKGETDTSGFTRQDYDEALSSEIERLEQGPQLMDMEETEDGVYVKPYFVAGTDSIEHGFYLYCDSQLYSISCKRDTRKDIDDPVPLMMAYLYTTES